MRQTSVPDLTEMSEEPKQILEMYGAKPGVGINHLRLTMKFQGIDARLTSVSGEVVKGILA